MKYRHLWTLEGMIVLSMSATAKSSELSIGFMILAALMFIMSWTPWGDAPLVEETK